MFRPIRFATTLWLVVSALVSTSAAYGAPTVNGHVISWPDDGWYQVQAADTYAEVCNGGRSCQVSEGTYNVINHSTGERFKNIVVTGESEGGEPTVSAVTVNGQTISWPDDGWYQVQDAETYRQVCAGGRSCEVEPGTYVVINHSTGERFKNIEVSDESGGGEPTVSAVTVNGQTISWPDDGWYQVQDAETYAEICNGGLTCEVEPGIYVVINHSTGQRYTDIEVDGTPTLESTRVAFKITVPEYVSDELQVQLNWGDEASMSSWTASWEHDESWSVDVDLPTNTERFLSIIFSDQNGHITLGSFDTRFSTGTSTATQTYRISAEQFDTERWDDDSDGVSNLNELLVGTNPLVPEATADFSLLDVSNDVIHASSGHQLYELFRIVFDTAYAIRQTTTITWPDSDWYQVQIVENEISGYPEEFPEVYNTVCNGGSICKLLPGRHAVINHTTGERSYLTIPTLSVEEQTNATPYSDASYTSTDPVYENWTANVTRTQYACELGGTMMHEIKMQSTGGTNHPYIRYVFDQCRMTVRSGLLPDDDYLLHGSVERVIINHSNGILDASFHYNYENFSIIAGSGLEYHAQAHVRDAGGYYWPHARTASIMQYQKVLPDGQVSELVTDVHFEYQVGSSLGNRHREAYTLNARGIVSNENTAYQRVSLQTNSTLNYKLDMDHQELVPFNGSMEMLAEDGSFLYLNANPSFTFSSTYPHYAFDLDYTTKNGEQILETSSPIYLYAALLTVNRCKDNRRPSCE